MSKFICLSVRVPNSNIIISENHSDINVAMERGDTLARKLGGSWTMTFNSNKVKVQ